MFALLRCRTRLIARLLIIAARLLLSPALLWLILGLTRFARLILRLTRLLLILRLMRRLLLLPVLELLPILSAVLHVAVIIIERGLLRPHVALRAAIVIEAHGPRSRRILRMAAIVLGIEAAIRACGLHVLLLH